MLNLRIRSAQDLFFDRAKVIAAIDRGTRRALSWSGSLVMREARSLTKRKGQRPGKDGKIKKDKRVGKTTEAGGSLPGQPPRQWTGLLNRNIFFAADLVGGGVIIGPARLNARDNSAPATLEYGGTATVTRTRWQTGRRVVEKRRVRIAARPYMAPSLRRVAPKLPEQFRNSVSA